MVRKIPPHRARAGSGGSRHHHYRRKATAGLLGCRGNHGGAEYEQLVSNGQLILQLHSFQVEHHHGWIADPDDRPYGNGVLLWFEVDDFDA
jgi:hypothetical protein